MFEPIVERLKSSPDRVLKPLEQNTFSLAVLLLLEFSIREDEIVFLSLEEAYSVEQIEELLLILVVCILKVTTVNPET